MDADENHAGHLAMGSSRKRRPPLSREGVHLTGRIGSRKPGEQLFCVQAEVKRFGRHRRHATFEIPRIRPLALAAVSIPKADMQILIAASEFSPLARTGGLGEAVSGIAHGVAAAGHTVRVVIPRYRHLHDIGVEYAGAGPAASLWLHRDGDIEVVLVDDPVSFDRAGIYGDTPGSGYDDQWLRYGRFSNVVADLANEADVVHLHDAHTGAVALLTQTPTVFTVHNAAYPITGPLEAARHLLGVDASVTIPGGPLEWYGDANYLKAGMAGAHVVTTVSPAFARQLLVDPSVSGGLDGVLQARTHAPVGIVNGIDPVAWDASSDEALASVFSSDDLDARLANRETLMEMAGIDDGVIFANVGRMAEQKGLGLLDEEIDQLIAEGARFVLVGSGELDAMVDGWVQRHPTAVWHGPYNEGLNRLVAGASDCYLMPSQFEPCGIGQMYAMRYGSIPVVRLTGGLADTVTDIDERPDRATGFGFRSFESVELAKTIRRAMRTIRTDPEAWIAMQQRGMTTDFSWEHAALSYIEAYEEAIRLR